MPVEIKITGNTAPEAVNELFIFLGTMHLQLSGAVKNAVVSPAPKVPEPETQAPEADPVKAETAEKPKGKKAKEEKPVEKVADTSSKYTLQEVMDHAKKAIVGSGDEAKGKIRLEKINEKFGVKKVRELPVDKLDAYVEAVDAEFPQKSAGEGMFD